MSTMMIALLAAFTQADGCCAPSKNVDASCCTTAMVTVGKHYERRTVCVHPEATPGKVRVEVKPEDRQPGDDEGYKTVGKHQEKAWYRWVDAPKMAADSDCSKASSKESCSYGVFPAGKQLVRKSFCEHGGERMKCGTMSGECDVCLK